jgi:hypothetical protein
MPSAKRHMGRITPSGIVFTTLLVAFVLLAATWWWAKRPGDHTPSLARLCQNEMRAFDHLERIVDAQRVYFDKSQSLFGEHRYAAFITHLWTAVDPAGKPVRIDLIPEHLAVAIGTTKATSGYYFVDVRERVELPRRDFQPIDYQRQWTVAAIPQQTGRTGSLVFMVDQTAAIFARPVSTFSSLYPMDPAADGWVRLPGREALSRLQQ